MSAQLLFPCYLGHISGGFMPEEEVTLWPETRNLLSAIWRAKEEKQDPVETSAEIKGSGVDRWLHG